jgi:hypothetical protein
MKELYTLKIIQKTSVAYLELHTHTSQQKNSQPFVSNDPGDYCCFALRLKATSFENGNPITEELVCSAVSKERVCNSCATSISYTISHGTTQLSEIVCKMHIAQLLQTLYLLTTEHTNSSVVG